MSDSNNAAALAVQSGLVLQRVENDTLVQIAIARPRDEVEIEKKILATIERHPEFADDSLYEFQKGGSTIRGLSVVAAREVARMWGNNATRTSFIDQGDGQIVACGIFVDMETGRRSEKQVPVPRVVKRKRESHRLSDDEYNMQARIEASKMERNAILDCLPVPMKSAIYAKCVKVSDDASEKGQDPVPVRWEKFKKSLEKIKVTPEQALAYLKLKAAEELTHTSLNQLKRTLKAINDGETSAAVVFGLETETKPDGGAPAGSTSGATVKEKGAGETEKDPNFKNAAGRSVEERAEKSLPRMIAERAFRHPADDGGTKLIAEARAELEKIVEGPVREKAVHAAFGSSKWEEIETFSITELIMATDGKRVEKIVAEVLGKGTGELFTKGGQ